MALQVLTIQWEGLEGTEGALSVARLRDDLMGKRDMIKGLLLNMGENPDRWTDGRYTCVGKVGTSGGNHFPGGDTTCFAEIIFDDECISPEDAVRKMRQFLSDEIFGSIELELDTEVLTENRRGYDWLFTN